MKWQLKWSNRHFANVVFVGKSFRFYWLAWLVCALVRLAVKLFQVQDRTYWVERRLGS